MPAIARLRELLAHDPDTIDRHFQLTELEVAVLLVQASFPLGELHSVTIVQLG